MIILSFVDRNLDEARDRWNGVPSSRKKFVPPICDASSPSEIKSVVQDISLRPVNSLLAICSFCWDALRSSKYGGAGPGFIGLWSG